jgi:hypothetical protein
MIHQTAGKTPLTSTPLSILFLVFTALILAAGTARGNMVTGTGEVGHAELLGGFSGTPANGTIYFQDTVTGVEIINTDNGIPVSASGQTLRGTLGTTYGTVISGTASSLITNNNLANINPLDPSFDPSSSYSTALADFGTAFTSFLSLSSMNTGSMIYIQGDGNTRTYTGPAAAGNNNKLIRMDSGVTNFSIDNIRFKDFKIQFAADDPYTAPNGAVNTFIGNVSNNAQHESFGHIKENEFSNIEITVTTNNVNTDKNYLAGGGIIGLRSTDGSTEIGSIEGNIFRNLSVVTTNTTADGKPYIEGGGIIGVDGVSSPAVKKGIAQIGELKNNLFYQINIDSGDIILGGGVVGVNNNSRATDDTEANLLTVSGNIFGSGTKGVSNGGIDIKSQYALRGGGVIGLNALSNATNKLDILENNTFAGITVNVGTYIRGGGIVGLQANENSNKTTGSTLNIAQDNLFYNIEVTTGTFRGTVTVPDSGTATTYEGGNIEGGGIIGLRSMVNASSLAALQRNVFRGINISATTSGSASSDGQFGDIRGGGLVGISSATTVALGFINDNYFDNISVIAQHDLLGGGVIGVDAADSVTAAAFVGVINGNYFIGSSDYQTFKVEIINDTIGGGIIGVRAEKGSAFGISFEQNRFEYIYYSSNNLKGGGLLGLAAPTNDPANTGNAHLGSVDGNQIKDSRIVITDNITGGGIIGVYSETGKAEIDTVSNNVIIDTDTANPTVIADEIFGGGLIGVAGTKDQGEVYIYDITGNEIQGNAVEATSILFGGGIFGAYSLEGKSEITSVTGANIFHENTVKAETLYGGGIIGASGVTNTSNPDATAHILTVKGNVFHDNTVSDANLLFGGGIIGAMSAFGLAELGDISENEFSELKVQTLTNNTSSLLGGGIIGALGLTSTAPARINNVSGNDYIANEVTLNGLGMVGGGLIGVMTWQGPGEIGTISGNTFNKDNKVKTTRPPSGQSGPTSILGSIQGGGFIGVVGYEPGSTAHIGTITSNYFLFDKSVSDPAVSSAGFIMGGGIIGTWADESSSIDSVIGNVFINIKVSAGTFIDGGGIIGVNGLRGTRNNAPDPNMPKVHISLIEYSTFVGNEITANNGPIGGGAVYTFGLGQGDANGTLKISNSWFTDNKFSSTVTPNTGIYNGINNSPDAKVYGTVVVDTGTCNKFDGSGDCINKESYDTLILEANGNNNTIFRNNEINENGAKRYNSLYFGGVQIVDWVPVPYSSPIDGEYETLAPKVMSNAKLVIDAQSGSQVQVLDPIKVDQLLDNDTATYAGSFFMEVLGNGGDFIWDGDNVFLVGTYDPDDHGIILNNVELRDNSRTILKDGMTLDAEEHIFHLSPAGYMEVNGWEKDPLHFPNQTNTLWIKKAQLEGQIHFMLNGDDVNNADRVLLKVYPTNNDTTPGQVSVEGALITLSSFTLGRELVPGDDRFFLISAGSEEANDHESTASNYSIGGTPRNQYASSRRSNMTDYEFIIDRMDKPGGTDTTGNRFQVARLRRIAPSPTTTIFTQGFAVGSAFMAQTSTWLPDHSYQQADMAINGDNYWQIFAGIDFSRFNLDVMDDFDINASTFLAGVAKKYTGDLGKFLFGVYVEGGYGKFDIGDEVQHINGLTELIKGEGHLRYIGLGLMARQTFNNKFRIEASFRSGTMENDFKSTVPNFNENDYLGYKLRTPYLAAHLGLAYMYDINAVSSLDFVLRGYWSRLNGKSVYVEDGEHIAFSDTDSLRARGGIRYTRLTPNDTYWYVGGYYDYEFDQKFTASVEDGRFQLDTPSMTGGTGIFEIGLISHPTENKHFSLEFGFQGYVGEIEGLSGGIRLGYEF